MKCPGQDSQYWNAEAIFEVECPRCAAPVEFYKDDTNRKCHKCGHRFVNPKMDFGCAAYCQYAEQCLGTLPEEFAGARDNLLKDKVAVEIKRLYGRDFGRIGRLTRIARHAEDIGKGEGANLPVILCAAYLQDVADSPHPEDPAADPLKLARKILTGLKANETMIDAVCTLLDRGGEEHEGASLEKNVLADARILARLDEECKYHPEKGSGPDAAVADSLATTTARKLAARFQGDAAK